MAERRNPGRGRPPRRHNGGGNRQQHHHGDPNLMSPAEIAESRANAVIQSGPIETLDKPTVAEAIAVPETLMTVVDKPAQAPAPQQNQQSPEGQAQQNYPRQHQQHHNHNQHQQRPQPEPQIVVERPKMTEQELMEAMRLHYMGIADLKELAATLGIPNVQGTKKMDLVLRILQTRNEGNGLMYTRGALDVLPDGYGFLRTQGFRPSPDDVYISQAQVRRFNLRVGDMVCGLVRTPKEGERYCSLVRIDSINGQDPEKIRSRPSFQNLTPLYPDSHLKLEHGATNLTARLVDIIAPIGKGQRGMIVSPPKAGKTTILKDIANSVHQNHPEVWIKVLLVDERPEEVTDMERSVHGEVLSSTFDEPPENHVKAAELVLESAKRMVESGMDVLILLDSITRLARAYNLVVPPSGRTLSGGIDPSSLHKPKRFFGGARNIEGGGSLTIIATALVDTGSRMDDIIYEEFKGTGNMELHLDRNLANRRIFPAIDVVASGTRKEDLLLSEDQLKKVYMLRRNMSGDSATEELVKLLKNSKTNEEFFNSAIFKY